MKKASYANPLDTLRIQCTLCPHHCILRNGKKGICLTRGMKDGILYTNNYLRPVSMAMDPIEKKPLYHFYPGSTICSLGPNGCTFKCTFCQNYQISQCIVPTHEISVQSLIQRAIENNSIGIAYTYSEPYIWFETIMDVAPAIKEAGLVSVMVTNGFFEKEPLNELLPVIDAMNIDIKSMDPNFYKRICKGKLEPVLASCETAKKQCHVEITNLLIQDINDSDEHIIRLVDFIANHLGKDTPLHFSRFFPRFRMQHAQTDLERLKRAWHIASQRLSYVYLGNCGISSLSITSCPRCKCDLILRDHYHTTLSQNLAHDSCNTWLCRQCSTSIPLITKVINK